MVDQFRGHPPPQWGGKTFGNRLSEQGPFENKALSATKRGLLARPGITSWMDDGRGRKNNQLSGTGEPSISGGDAAGIPVIRHPPTKGFAQTRMVGGGIPFNRKKNWVVRPFSEGLCAAALAPNVFPRQKFLYGRFQKIPKPSTQK